MERVFADVKEKHAMRDTQYRGPAQVAKWVRRKFAAFAMKSRILNARLRFLRQAESGQEVSCPDFLRNR
jgi:hypothetical protein